MTPIRCALGSHRWEWTRLDGAGPGNVLGGQCLRCSATKTIWRRSGLYVVEPDGRIIGKGFSTGAGPPPTRPPPRAPQIPKANDKWASGGPFGNEQEDQ